MKERESGWRVGVMELAMVLECVSEIGSNVNTCRNDALIVKREG